MKAMILAAGFGTRLRPVTNIFAKPAVPFLNVPLLYYSMALLERAGVDHFVINSHYLPRQIDALARAAPRLSQGLSTTPIVKLETGAPLGSGGGIWNAKAELQDSDFWLANGDEVILPRLANIFESIRTAHQSKNALATLVVMEHPGVGSQFGGVWATQTGAVAGFGKNSSEYPGTRGYHYIGLQLISPRIFKYLPEGESNILYDALKCAIAAGETVQVVVGDFTWFETGNTHDYLQASKECLELLRYPEKSRGCDREFLINTLASYSGQIKNGNVEWRESILSVARRASSEEVHSTVHSEVHSTARPGNSMHGAIVLAAPTAHIAKSAQFEGAVTIGANTSIGEGVIITNSAVLEGATVPAGVVISDQIVLPEKHRS